MDGEKRFEAVLGDGRGAPATSTPLARSGKDAALAALRARRADPPERVEDGSLPAGAPMHFYCDSCGHESDELPEDWWETPPKKLCVECQALTDQGWL